MGFAAIGAVFTKIEVMDEMAYKRILTIQDISCVGQCSATVALPVLSVCGHETCILPTALLSTHTGGFGKPAVAHLDSAMEPILRHWQENGILFDAILVGYLGSLGAIRSTMEILDTMLAPGGVAIVDPVMGDHGALYSGFDQDYVDAMKQLCKKARVILPNITEAALLSGLAYEENLTEYYVNQLLEQMTVPTVVLTGVGYSQNQTGVVLHQSGATRYYPQTRIGTSYHGTGDLFAACLTGSWMYGKNLWDSVRISADFTKKVIENTEKSPAHWYGIKFEPVLSTLIDWLEKQDSNE